MSFNKRLISTFPLRSALPDVYLRKNKFEERLLQKRKKSLEIVQKKIIDRLAREQEEYAMFSCLSMRAESTCRTEESTNIIGNPEVKKKLKRSTSDTVLQTLSPRPTSSCIQDKVNRSKESQNVNVTNRRKERAKSSSRVRVTFSGRDGRPMTLTPIMEAFGKLSLNTNGHTRLISAGKQIRNLPRSAQTQLRNTVYFLSQHKIQQNYEVTKIREARAKLARNTSN